MISKQQSDRLLTQWLSVKLQWQSNQRLRLLAYLVLIIVLFSMALDIRDYKQAQQNDLKKIQHRLLQVQRTAGQKEWLERSEKAKKQLKVFQQQIWQAETKGIAQASLQAWLQLQITDTNIENVRLNVEKVQENSLYPNYWQVVAKITGLFEVQKLELLLKQLDDEPKSIIVQQLDVKKRYRNPQFTLVVYAWFQQKN